MDIKDIIRQIAPVAASLIGGPLAGVAVKALGDAIGMSEPTQERVVAAIQSGSVSPEQLAAIRKADNDLKIRLRELDLDHEKIEADTEKAYLADTQDARKSNAGDQGVFWLGIGVLIIMLLDVVSTFWLVYSILTGGLQIKDVGIVAAVFGILGTLNGYVAANAQQVLSYYFGSSRGSQDKSAAMAEAIKALPSAVK
jgi:hypothetical protein